MLHTKNSEYKQIILSIGLSASISILITLNPFKIQRDNNFSSIFAASSLICHHGSLQTRRVLLRLISCFLSEPRPWRLENAVNVLLAFGCL